MTKNLSTTSMLFSRELSLNLNGKRISLDPPLIMGIINATPDSFYHKSRIPEPGSAVEMAKNMIDQGADLLDIGAVSSRPGAEDISEEEELRRLSPVVEAIRQELPDCILSVDTWRSGIVRKMHHQYRIDMVNDVTAGQRDPAIFNSVADLGLPYVMMHMKGTPSTMQEEPQYKDVVDDILQFFGERLHKLRKMGVNDIIVDPGFGFGKTLEQNYRLLRDLDAFQILELPVMVGVSRKSMIYNSLSCTPEESLNGTTAVHMAALMKGASLLRVHDVQAAVETVKIFHQIVDSGNRAV